MNLASICAQRHGVAIHPATEVEAGDTKRTAGAFTELTLVPSQAKLAETIPKDETAKR